MFPNVPYTNCALGDQITLPAFVDTWKKEGIELKNLGVLLDFLTHTIYPSTTFPPYTLFSVWKTWSKPIINWHYFIRGAAACLLACGKLLFASQWWTIFLFFSKFSLCNIFCSTKLAWRHVFESAMCTLVFFSCSTEEESGQLSISQRSPAD